jgi:hypothetical protein
MLSSQNERMLHKSALLAVEFQSQASLQDVEMGGDRHSDTGGQSVNEDEAGMNDHSSSVSTDHVYAVLEREDTSASLKHEPAC